VYWNNYAYNVWNWGPWAPFYGWANYTGWVYGLGLYIVEGMYCYADNTALGLEWTGGGYYYSDDAISSALATCANDPNVVAQGLQGSCIIRTCASY
jgi:hypothetical protein